MLFKGEDFRVNEYTRSLNKNKSGSGSMMYRVSLPIDLVRELELEDIEHVVLSLENDSIIIKKEEEKKEIKSLK